MAKRARWQPEKLHGHNWQSAKYLGRTLRLPSLGHLTLTQGSFLSQPFRKTPLDSTACFMSFIMLQSETIGPEQRAGRR
jgi:hypothetical protein